MVAMYTFPKLAASPLAQRATQRLTFVSAAAKTRCCTVSEDSGGGVAGVGAWAQTGGEGEGNVVLERRGGNFPDTQRHV